MTAQVFVIFDGFYGFNFFSSKLELKSFLKFWNIYLCSWVLYEYSQELQILHTNAPAQMLWVFKMWRFLFHFKVFKESFENFCHFQFFINNTNLDFFKIWIKTNHRKSLNKIWNFEHWVLSEDTQRLQIFFSIYAAFYELSKIRSTGGALHRRERLLSRSFHINWEIVKHVDWQINKSKI